MENNVTAPTASGAVSSVLFPPVNAITNSARQCPSDGVETVADYFLKTELFEML